MDILLFISEHNPFGEDDDTNSSDTTNQIDAQTASKTDYDSTLNPFADDDSSLNPFADDEDEPITETTSNVPQSKETVSVAPTKQKLVPSNPFEVSDEEETPAEEVSSKKKIIPETDLAIEKPKPPAVKHNKIILPDTNALKKTTPKKKLAPVPPQTSSPAANTPSISDNKENTAITSAHSRQTGNGISSSEKFIDHDKSRIDDDNMSIDAQKKKHRPAPPRPMPPKRRVRKFTPSILDCTSCLSSKASKVNSRPKASNAPQWKY